MLVVWSWLKELVEFDREISAEEGAKALTGAGLEVEEFRRVGSDFSGVVIAEVVSKEKHPKADKLTVVQVKDSDSGDTTTVVCGAPNVPEPGGRVLWAKPGAVLPGGFELGAKELKGVMSAGMLCAEDELGLGDDHDGIVVLGEEAKSLPLGADAAEALGLKDVVFDLCIPANRADALGHFGVAQELAALLDGKIRYPDTDLTPYIDESVETSSRIQVTIHDEEACPRYLAHCIDGLEVKPSPMWMQQRLRNVGVRPINNLVDVTNYVLFELAQPLHAFDYDKVQGAEINVRRATAGEKMVTLDDTERELVETDLLICDGEAPVALAGVMGGQTSEVSADTTRVLLESANFEPMTIRRTARRLGLHSDSSHRFERSVDPNGTARAGARAALLLAKLGGGKVAKGSVDVYPAPVTERQVKMRLSRCAMLSGIEVPRETVIETLERQGLEVVDSGEDHVEVKIPTFRGDITREVDLIEEVVRMYGFDKVPATLPQTTVRPTRVADRRRVGARRAMLNAGYCESLTYGFTSPQKIAAMGFESEDPRSTPIPIDNPMTIEQSVMRTSLWPNLLTAISHNEKRQVHDVRLYELGSVFLPSGEEMPHEPLELCAVLAGSRKGWLGEASEVDFYDAKGGLELVLKTIYGSLEGFTIAASDRAPGYLHPGVSARVIGPDGQEIGWVGEVHPKVRAAFDLTQVAFGFELRLDRMPTPKDFSMVAIPRYPAVTRDISMLLDVAVPASQVIEVIEKGEEPLLQKVTILEDYRDPAHVPEGKKGMLWSITYRSGERTLTDAEVDTAHQALEDRLLSELGASRR